MKEENIYLMFLHQSENHFYCLGAFRNIYSLQTTLGFERKWMR